MEYIFSLTRIWTDSIDFKNEECVSSVDFFEYIQEPKSDYGLWLFKRIDVDPNRMTFTDYLSLVTQAALLGRNDLLAVIFQSSERDALRLEDWTKIVETMLFEEIIPFPRNVIISAFARFSKLDSQNNHVLTWKEFIKLTSNYPLVVQPFLRLIANVRKYHLGERFWRRKKVEIMSAYERAKNNLEMSG